MRDRNEFLHDVFTTALEGGIGYWSYTDQYISEVKGFKAVIEVQDDDYDPDTLDIRVINAATISRGIHLFSQYALGRITRVGRHVPVEDQRPVGLDHYWRQFLKANETNGDEGDFDADVADLIVQFGLFGEAVYG